jgi:hypothetical protein
MSDEPSGVHEPSLPGGRAASPSKACVMADWPSSRDAGSLLVSSVAIAVRRVYLWVCEEVCSKVTQGYVGWDEALTPGLMPREASSSPIRLWLCGHLTKQMG